MSELNRAYNITLVDKRCYDCGRYYMIESGFPRLSQCPYCARDEVRRFRDNAITAERAASTYKGIITRLKKGGAK